MRIGHYAQAVHDHVHEQVNVNVGRQPFRKASAINVAMIVDVHVVVDVGVDGFWRIRPQSGLL